MKIKLCALTLLDEHKKFSRKPKEIKKWQIIFLFKIFSDKNKGSGSH